MYSWKIILILCLGLLYHACFAQEILELRFCVLFDTYQEQQLIYQWQTGKEVNLLSLLSAYDPDIDKKALADFSTDLEKSLSRLQNQKTKRAHTSWWVKQLFYRLHHKFLKNYQVHASFADLVKNGNYNCLSGTLLYAYALEYLNIPFVIYEAPHHVYLRVFLEEKTLIFEATDPLQGIKEEVEPHYMAAKAIGWRQAIGLQYFNLGVERFEKGEYLNALRSLRKAQYFYPASERIKEHMTYIFSLYEQHDWLSLKKN